MLPSVEKFIASLRWMGPIRNPYLFIHILPHGPALQGSKILSAECPDLSRRIHKSTQKKGFQIMPIEASRKRIRGAQVDGTEKQRPTRHRGKVKAGTCISISIMSRKIKVDEHSDIWTL